MKYKKGSLSVEAIISFTVYIGIMFLLLTIVKLAAVLMILNNTAAETAKTIAVSAYPISFLNEKQSDLEKLGENITLKTSITDITDSANISMVSYLVGGNGSSFIKKTAIEQVKELVGGVAVNILKGSAYELKGSAVSYLCGMLSKNYIDNCGIPFDEEKIVLKVTKIPITEAEYNYLYKDKPISLSTDAESSVKIIPSSSHNGTDGHFNADDVVICLEYPYRIALPMLPAFDITLRSVAVEHAWINSTATGPSRKEGIDISNIMFGANTQVCIPTGGHGKRYHKKDCHCLWTSKQTVTLQAALSMGFTPCKVCRPDDKSN